MVSFVGNGHGCGTGQPREDSIRTLERYLHTTDSVVLRKSLVVMLGETGRLQDVHKHLKLLEADSSNGPLVAAVRWAYLDGDRPDLSADDRECLSEIPVEWARDKLFAAQARKLGQETRVAEINAKIIARGRMIHVRAASVTTIMLGITLAGMIVFGAWFFSGRSDITLGDSLVIGQWDFATGCGVLVRTAMYSLIVTLPLAMIPDYVWGLALAYLISTGVLLWLVQKHLLRPVGLPFFQSFGLNLLRGCGKRVVWVSLGVMGLEWFGSLLLSAVFAHMGVRLEWVEMVPEEFLHKTWAVVATWSFTAVLVAPFIEEVTCRGILFLTLRTRLAFGWAAAVTALIFSILHLYSLSGFLQLLWVSLIWTLAFTRTRSLLPCIISHAVGNLFFTILVILAYRI